jgi:hypothetical protein
MRSHYCRCLVAALALATAEARGAKKWRPTAAPTDASSNAAAAPTTPAAEPCLRCMSAALHLLTVSSPRRACPAANATLLSSMSPDASAYCPSLLPKKRPCSAFVFGADASYSYASAFVALGCSVVSFDAYAQSGTRRVSANHTAIPLALGTENGIAYSDAGAIYPTMTLPVLIASTPAEKLDVLRVVVSTMGEWKVLKGVINSGILSEVRQLSLRLTFADPALWPNYEVVLDSLRAAGFLPLYSAHTRDATYLRVQEGDLTLYSAYEMSYGNSRVYG